jgi:hypothetical protein
MKRELGKYVGEYHTCQRVKVEHQSLARKWQPLPIPTWKWEEIGMDFVTGFLMSKKIWRIRSG